MYIFFKLVISLNSTKVTKPCSLQGPVPNPIISSVAFLMNDPVAVPFDPPDPLSSDFNLSSDFFSNMVPFFIPRLLIYHKKLENFWLLVINTIPERRKIPRVQKPSFLFLLTISRLVLIFILYPPVLGLHFLE